MPDNRASLGEAAVLVSLAGDSQNHQGSFEGLYVQCRGRAYGVTPGTLDWAMGAGPLLLGTGTTPPALGLLTRVAWLGLRRDAEAFEPVGLLQRRAG